MKKILIALAILCVGLGANAQDYKQILKQTMDAFDTTRSFTAKVQMANKVNLIAKKYNTEWAPQYYAAYAQAGLSMQPELMTESAKRDAYLDEAETHLADAVTLLGKQTDETHVMAAVIANYRLSVDGQKRWQQYGKVFEKELDDAKAINPDNPRMYLLKGINKMYTPTFFGGGKEASKPYFEKAKDLMDKEPNDDITKPYWGEGITAYFMKEIAGDDEKK